MGIMDRIKGWLNPYGMRFDGHMIVEVRKGDTLSGLAKRYLGDAKKWDEIYKLNYEEIGDDPDFILPGMKLKIPKWDEIS